jgi:hypothetical protein
MRHKHTVLLACACALVALVGATALHAEPPPDPPVGETTTTTEESVDGADTAAPQVDLARIQHAIKRLRRETWYWQRVMGLQRTRGLAIALVDPQQRLDAWRRLAARTRRQAQNPPHKQQWLCIHRYEGGWRDPSPPYYGGLQMDVQFQRTYGAAIFRLKGTADHWTPLEQMWAAERAHRSGRGFYPWPNTARYCGLI